MWFVTMPQDEFNALDSKTTWETEALVFQSEFVGRTTQINIHSGAKVSDDTHWGTYIQVLRWLHRETWMDKTVLATGKAYISGS